MNDGPANIEQRRADADESLRLAIIEHAEAHFFADSDTEMLYEFVIVGAWQPTRENGTTVYTLHSRTGDGTPAHVWRGLLYEGLACCDDRGHRARDVD